MKLKYCRNLLVILMLALGNMESKAEDVFVDSLKFSLNKELKTAKLESNSYSGNIVIPQSIRYEDVNYHVTEISSYCFESCSNLASVVIPEGVTTIGRLCFTGTDKMTSIILPSTIQSLGDGAFQSVDLVYCNALIPPSVDNDEPFWYRSENHVLFVPYDSYYDYRTSSAWGNTGHVISKGDGAIRYSQTTYKETFEYVLYDDLSAKLIKYESRSETGIQISSIDFEGEQYTVTEIGDEAFLSANITKITLGSSIVKIGERAFMGCSKLCEINLSDNLSSFGESCFYGCIALTSIKIPNTVTSLPTATFQGCSSLTEIEIPSLVTSIGNDCFNGCDKIETFICDAINPPSADESSLPLTATLYLNSLESYANYKQTAPWNNFASIVACEDKESSSDINNIKLTSISQIYDGSRVKIYPVKSYGVENKSLSSTGVNGGLTKYSGSGNGNIWNLVDAGNGYYYIHNDLGGYWAYQTSRDPSNKMTCSTKEKAVKVKIELLSDGVYFQNSQDNYYLNNLYDYDNRYNWWYMNGSPFAVKIVSKRDCEVMIDGNKYMLSDGATLETTTQIGDIVIPQKITIKGEDYIVKKIADHCFENNENIASITLPETITGIGSLNLSGCNNLTTITLLSTNVPTVSDLVLPTSLKKIDVPYAVYQNYKDDANWSKVNNIVAENNEYIRLEIEDIEYQLGKQSAEATIMPGNYSYAIYVPETVSYELKNYKVTSLGENCFANSNKLVSINIPAVKTIGGNALKNCSSLKYLTIKSSVVPTLSDESLPTSIEYLQVPQNMLSTYQEKLLGVKSPKLYLWEHSMTVSC